MQAKAKPAGLCPYCKKMVHANVIVENDLRRDQCQCPSCEELIYVCRSPGCHDFAKAGEYYDEELCPVCTKGAAKIGVGIATAALFIITGGKSNK